MYPGKFLSLANKGWDWASLLKHVGIWVKKKYIEKYMKKKERITRKVIRILEQIKWRSKDQNSKKSKKVKDTKGQYKLVNSKISKIKLSRKWRIQRIP